MAVKVSLVDGNSGRLDSQGWAEKEMLIVVTGNVRTLGQDNLLSVALGHAEAEGYTYGSQHPSISNLYLLGDRRLAAASSTRVVITAQYERKTVRNDPDYIEITGDVTLVQERTNKDKDDNDLYTEWKKDASATAKRQPGMVDIWLPCETLEFAKQFGTTCPRATAKQYVGFRNSAEWQGEPAGAWLCMAFPYKSPDSGEHWEGSIRFALNPKKWEQTIYYVAEDGRPPENYSASYNDGLTVKQVEVYGDVDYGALNLPSLTTP